MQKITLLGSTGSIGQNTLDVIRRHPERYSVFALSAHSQADKLAAQCIEFQPTYAVIGDAQKAGTLSALLAQAGCKTEVLYGAQALEQIAATHETDTVMAAIVGAVGLSSALAAARAGKRILLANKEALVMAGPLFMAEVHKNRAVLLPIDSEHNAIFQSLPRNFSENLPLNEGVRAIHLTASGGPFRDTPLSALKQVTPKQACAHPNWVMGRKISVDSATMMNKGLELIEAHFLFNLPASRLRVVVHPQSIVHSLVEYIDGSFIAQLGSPDMRTPIAHALAYPERIESGVTPLDFATLSTLTFMPPDLDRFPCLALAYQAMSAGGTAPAILNAANEIAVEAFLAGNLPYPDIARVIAETLQRVPVQNTTTLADIENADTQARRQATDLLKIPVSSH